MPTDAAFAGELYAIDENHFGNEAGCEGGRLNKWVKVEEEEKKRLPKAE